MSKFIQIAACGGDEMTRLFALDSDGVIWEHNFAHSRWIETMPAYGKCGCGQSIEIRAGLFVEHRYLDRVCDMSGEPAK